MGSLLDDIKSSLWLGATSYAWVAHSFTVVNTVNTDDPPVPGAAWR